MKRALAALTVVAALIALAAPASSMAGERGVFPAGHSFEISGEGMPVLAGGLAGGCTVSKISGSIPASPGNIGAFEIPLASPTFSCSTGVSIGTTPGAWDFIYFGSSKLFAYEPLMQGPGPWTLRYASLPGCKLEIGTLGSRFSFNVVWSNGTQLGGANSPSAFHGDNVFTGIWHNDGSTCAMAGTPEKVTFHSGSSSPGTPYGAKVTDTTVPGGIIVFSLTM